MSETGDKVVSDRDRVLAACPGAYTGVGDGEIFCTFPPEGSLMRLGDNWTEATKHQLVVAFEAQHRPASQPAQDVNQVLARAVDNWEAAKKSADKASPEDRKEFEEWFHAIFGKPANDFQRMVRSTAWQAWYVSRASIKPEAPEGAKEEFLIPEFIHAMNDIGRYGHEKYGEESFQHRRKIGDTSRRLERCSPKEIMDHAHNHFQLHVSGVPHDKFHTYRHQLAAVAFNAMMEYYFSSKEPVISVREAGK